MPSISTRLGVRKKMPDLLVQCDVETGLFKTEYLVSLLGSSFYVDQEDVRVTERPEIGRPVKGLVFAYLIEERDEQAFIELTGTPVMGGIRMSVPRAITQAA